MPESPRDAASGLGAVRFFMAAGLILIMDQISKATVVHDLQGHPGVPLLGKWLWLSYVENRGGAFGIFQSGSPVFILAGFLVASAMFYYRSRIVRLPRLEALALGLILGGTLGNLADRLRLGYVVDFIDLQARGHNIWPVFNVADSAICIGLTVVGCVLARSSQGPVASDGIRPPTAAAPQESMRDAGESAEGLSAALPGGSAG